MLLDVKNMRKLFDVMENRQNLFYFVFLRNYKGKKFWIFYDEIKQALLFKYFNNKFIMIFNIVVHEYQFDWPSFSFYYILISVIDLHICLAVGWL